MYGKARVDTNQRTRKVLQVQLSAANWYIFNVLGI